MAVPEQLKGTRAAEVVDALTNPPATKPLTTDAALAFLMVAQAALIAVENEGERDEYNDHQFDVVVAWWMDYADRKMRITLVFDNSSRLTVFDYADLNNVEPGVYFKQGKGTVEVEIPARLIPLMASESMREKARRMLEGEGA